MNTAKAQRAYNKRMSKRQKWCPTFITPAKPKDVTDADNFMFEDKKYKPKTIYR